MARNYVARKNNPYHLPHDLYMQMLYLIRDYGRMRQAYVDILYEGPGPSDGMPRGSGVGDPTGRKAERRLVLAEQIAAVDQTVVAMRGKYACRKHTYGELDPLDAYHDYGYYAYMFAMPGKELGASPRAWKLYRSRFAYMVAEKLHLF